MLISHYRFLDIKYLVTHKVWLYIIGHIKRNLMPVYYIKWSNNFGDMLTPLILKQYGFTPIFSYPKKSKCVVIGTILEILPSDYKGYILGSGWTRAKIGYFPNAKIYGIRGLLTKEYLKIDKNVCIGDPGLLMSKIYPCNLNKKYKVGIIPHESEIDDVRIKRIQSNNTDCCIINPRNKNCKSIIRLINSCEYIVSSSLHGLIISDSYGIPNGRIKINEIDNSQDFKFKDYYSSLDEKLHTFQITGNETLEKLISITRNPNTAKIKIIQKSLDKMFNNFKLEFK